MSDKGMGIALGLLAGVVIGGVLVNLDGAQASEDATKVQSSRVAAKAVNVTDGGGNRMQATREACRRASSLYAADKGAFFRDGSVSLATYKASRDTAAAVCAEAEAVQAEVTEAREATAKLERQFECKWLGCDGGT